MRVREKGFFPWERTENTKKGREKSPANYANLSTPPNFSFFLIPT
jgi:hypothetical protein